MIRRKQWGWSCAITCQSNLREVQNNLKTKTDVINCLEPEQKK